MTDHHHGGTTVVETEKDSSAGIIVGVLVALLIVFLIWLFLFGPMNVRGTDDADAPNVQNVDEGDEGDTNVDIQNPPADSGGDTTEEDTGGSGQTTP